MTNIFTERGWRWLGCLFALGFGIGAAFVIFAVVTITHMGVYEASMMAGRIWLSFVGVAWVAAKVWGIVRRWLWVKG